MTEIFEILLAGVVAMAIVIPVVSVLDKWKKEMDAKEDTIVIAEGDK